MTITVKDDAGASKQVTKIAGKKVTLDTGESIAWGMVAYGAVADQVEMEEAGTNAAQAGADDFEADAD